MTHMLIRALCLALLLVSSHAKAGTPDPLRVTMDRERVAMDARESSAPSYRMPVEACYVGRTYKDESTEHDPSNPLRVTIWNKLEGQGMVIRYIRSYDPDGAKKDAILAHDRERFVYILDTIQPSGEPIVRAGFAHLPQTREDRRVSVLRPGEFCTMWLPRYPPGTIGWMVVTERLDVSGAGTMIDYLRHCARSSGGALVDCKVRLDSTPYVPVADRLYGERIVNDTYYFIFDRTIHWAVKPP